MAVEIDVLRKGYSIFDAEKKIMTANCTCTLVRDEKATVIVDTLTAWDRSLLVEELQKRNLTCQKVTHVVCTHGHSDHVGNLNLFTEATHIVGQCISSHDVYYPFDQNAPYEISKNIQVFATPGHTLTDVSVLVKNTEYGTVVVAGDLFEREADIYDPGLWKDTAGSENPELQYENREKVLHIADRIIPGHGPMFTVTDDLRQLHAENKILLRP